jgi:hypothetical protein
MMIRDQIYVIVSYKKLYLMRTLVSDDEMVDKDYSMIALGGDGSVCSMMVRATSDCYR